MSASENGAQKSSSEVARAQWFDPLGTALGRTMAQARASEKKRRPDESSSATSVKTPIASVLQLGSKAYPAGQGDAFVKVTTRYTCEYALKYGKNMHIFTISFIQENLFKTFSSSVLFSSPLLFSSFVLFSSAVLLLCAVLPSAILLSCAVFLSCATATWVGCLLVHLVPQSCRYQQTLLVSLPLHFHSPCFCFSFPFYFLMVFIQILIKT